MDITFCGGAQEVGASCILVTIDGKNILLDCGIRMQGGKDRLPNFASIQQRGGVDAIVISHAHLDHSGSLPVISREYPSAPVFMTHVTRDLVRVLLLDSIKVMGMNEGEIPLYVHKHVKDMFDRVQCFSPFFAFRPFAQHPLRITFHPSGHIAGAACVFLEGNDGTVLYTGDISSLDQMTVSGAQVPRLRPDVVITEATYGDRLHTSRETEQQRLIEMVKEVWERRGKVLIPAFALGRSQEVILLLKQAISKGALPAHPVFVDGMVKEVNRAYADHPEYLRQSLARKLLKGHSPFVGDSVFEIVDSAVRQKVLDTQEPLCVVSSSGMLAGGPSTLYAARFAPVAENFIAITGYQDEESPGRRLLDLVDAPDPHKTITLEKVQVQVRCGVGRYGLSAHSDKSELLSLLMVLRPRNVFVVHGEPSVIQSFAREVSAELRSEVVIPRNGETHSLARGRPHSLTSALAGIRPLNRQRPLDKQGLSDLASHLLAADVGRQCFTAEDLCSLWSGKPQPSEDVVDAVRELLRDSTRFESDARRLFLYRPLAENRRADSQANSLEMNTLVALVDSLLPKESGLYRKSIDQKNRHCTLCFHFPLRAKQRYAAQIEQLQRKSSWKILTKPECHLGAAEELARSLLAGVAEIKRISFHRERNLLTVQVLTVPADASAIEKRFNDETGMVLSMISGPAPAAPTEMGLSPEFVPPRTELNAAIAEVQRAFRGCPHTLHRVGKKEREETPYLELSFISPKVGALYQERIRELQKQVGWNILVSQSVNQKEVIDKVNAACTALGVTLTRSPGVHTAECIVRVKPTHKVAAETMAGLKAKVLASTGLTLETV